MLFFEANIWKSCILYFNNCFRDENGNFSEVCIYIRITYYIWSVFGSSNEISNLSRGCSPLFTSQLPQ